MRKARNQLGKKGAEILQEAYQRVFRLKGGQRDDAGVLELVHGLLAKQNPVFASLVDNSFTKNALWIRLRNAFLANVLLAKETKQKGKQNTYISHSMFIFC